MIRKHTIILACFLTLLIPSIGVAQCSIQNLIVEAYEECNDDGSFNVDIDFEVTNGANQGFSVFIDGVFHSYFGTYPMPYVTIDSLVIDDTSFTVEVRDGDNPNCAADKIIEVPTCALTPPCNIPIFELNAFNCSDTGVYDLQFIIFPEDFPTADFNLYSNSELLYENEPINFEYLPYPITNSTQGVDVIRICATDNSCCIEVDVEAPNCDCTLTTDIIIDSVFCDGGGTYYQLDLEYIDNESEFFTFSIYNTFPEVSPQTYAYSDLPITIGPVESYLYNNKVFAFVEDEEGDCGYSEGLEYQSCTPINDCTIINIYPLNPFCNSNGTFHVNIAVSQLNQGTENFSVFVNGEDFGDYFYTNTFSLIGPLPADGVTGFDIVVIDNEFPDCTNSLYLPPVDCNPEDDCAIDDVSVDFQSCNEDGTYNAILNFEVLNTTHDHFDLWVNNEFHGYYALSSLPLTLGNIVPRENSNDEHIQICINDNPDCCIEYEYPDPNCEFSEDCIIQNVIAEAHECTPNGIFYVDLEITAQFVGDMGFSVLGNGNDYGDFSYDSTYITIGPLVGDGETIYEFVVVDNGIENCQNWTVIGPIDCEEETGDCEIGEVNVDFQNCNEDGTYNTILSFEYVNANNEFFDIWVNNEFHGFYPLTSLPLELENIVPRENSDYEHIKICINDNPNCCIEYEYLEPECGSSDGCIIQEVFAEAHECTPNGVFYVDLEVTAQFVGDMGFSVLGNGNDYGDFSYDSTYITIGPLVGDGETIYEFVVIDNGIENCQNWTVIGPIDCEEETGDCEIGEVNVDFQNCNEDGTYNTILSFEYVNANNEFFDIWVNNEFHGFYPLTSLPLELDSIVPRENSDYEHIKICINDNLNCCIEYEYLEPECGSSDGCIIQEVFAEAHECTPNGVFYVDLEVTAQFVGDMGFSVLGNGNDYGDFSYDSTYITIGPLVGDGETIYEFVVIDNGIENCQNWTVIGPIDCEEETGDCEIGEVNVDFQNCNEDGTYNTILSFEYVNANNEFFDIWVNNEFHGFYPLTSLPLELENIVPRENSDYEHIKICINDNPNCCIEYEYLEPECGSSDGCIIQEVFAEAHECTPNGVFYVDLEVTAQFVGDMGFSVLGNGNDYGDFSYDSTYITIGPLVGDGETIYEFVVIDNGIENCQNWTVIGPIDCEEETGDCEIGEVNVDFQNCNEDGTYNTILSFEYVNANNEFFDIWVNNEFHGFYPMTSLPLELENIVPRENSDYEHIKICINDNPNCCIEYEYLEPDCEEEDGCLLSNLMIEHTPCDENGTYDVTLNLEYQNPGNDYFEVWVNNEYEGFYLWSALPLSIEGVTPRENSDYDIIKVCVNDVEECCIIMEYLKECNQESECAIFDLLVTTKECDEEEMFYVDVNFEYENVESNFFEVVGNGQNYGTFLYTDLPIELGPFAGNTGVPHELIVFDTENEACAAEAIFGQNCTEYQCFGLEEYEEGTSFNGENTMPGDLIMEWDDVGVKFKEFTYFDGTTDAVVVRVEEPFVDDLDGNALWISNACIELGFTNTALPVNSVSMTFYDGGGEENLSVNGQAVLVLNNFAEAPLQIAPGVTLSITILEQDSYGNISLGVLTFTGDIQSILIGGQEFYLDDVCVDYALPPSPGGGADVWPGDANADNIANNYDLLSIGVAYGAEGPERAGINIDWMAMQANNWNATFEDGTNIKHADCNGDGGIETNDMFAVLENYNLTHGDVKPFSGTEGTPGDPPIFVDLPGAGDFISDETIELPIILGSNTIPVQQIYGLAFTIQFTPGLFKGNDFEMDFSNSMLGDINGDILTLNKNFLEDGRVDVAITRIDQFDIGGDGVLGYAIGIIDDLAGFTDVEAEIINLRAIQANEELVPLHTPVSSVDLTTNTTQIGMKNDLVIYPNPTSEQLFIRNESLERIQGVRVLDILGKEIFPNNVASDYSKLDVSNVESGIYILEIQFQTSKVFKKVEVFKD